MFMFEGPLASMTVQPGTFSKRGWKAIPREFAAQTGKTCRVVAEVAE